MFGSSCLFEFVCLLLGCFADAVNERFVGKRPIHITTLLGAVTFAVVEIDSQIFLHFVKSFVPFFTAHDAKVNGVKSTFDPFTLV